MSNNAPDYENNLAFPPRHDETAYELQLKVNKLEKENTQLRKWCEEFNALDVAKENQQLKELLKECQQSFRGIRVQIEEYEYSMAKNTAQLAIDEIDNAIGEKK